MQGAAELHVVLKNHRVLIPSQINGKDVFFILDTGASSSLLSPVSANRLAVPAHSAWGAHIYGVGGEAQLMYAQLNDLKLGQFDKGSQQILVAGGDYGDRDGVVGVIGYDAFAKWDLEFDLAHGIVRILKSSGCQDNQMVYWGAAYSQAPLRPRGEDNHTFVNVELNGAVVEAIMDTGAFASTVTLAGAQRAGLGPRSPGVEASGMMRGVGEAETPRWVGVFKSFKLGDETIGNARIGMADMFVRDQVMQTGSSIPRYIDMPGMLIGADFFQAHRVLISRTHEMVYFSYNGGPVFETRPPEAPAKSGTSTASAAPVPAGAPPSR